MSYTEPAYQGTSIGADGRRYANDDPDIPTVPPPWAGRPAHQSDVQATYDALDAATPTRSVADAVIVNADATVTSATADFTDADLGATIGGAGAARFPAGTVIATINAENSVEMSAPATSAGTGQTLTFTRTVAARLDSLEDRVAAIE